MKTLSIILVLFFMSSCGPQRMQCGHGLGKRCVENTQKEKIIVKTQNT